MRIVFVLAVFSLVAGYAWVSTMSYHDAVAQYQQCLDMVQAGAWTEEVCK